MYKKRSLDALRAKCLGASSGERLFFIIIKVYRILKYAAVAHFSNFVPSGLKKHYYKTYAEISHCTHWTRLTLETSDAKYYSDRY